MSKMVEYENQFPNSSQFETIALSCHACKRRQQVAWSTLVKTRLKRRGIIFLCAFRNSNFMSVFLRGFFIVDNGRWLLVWNDVTKLGSHDWPPARRVRQKHEPSFSFAHLEKKETRKKIASLPSSPLTTALTNNTTKWRKSLLILRRWHLPWHVNPFYRLMYACLLSADLPRKDARTKSLSRM